MKTSFLEVVVSLSPRRAGLLSGEKSPSLFVILAEMFELLEHTPVIDSVLSFWCVSVAYAYQIFSVEVQFVTPLLSAAHLQLRKLFP